MNDKVSRRQILGAAIGAVGALLGPSALGRAIDGLCLPTPAQTEGPYYPVQDQLDKDNDLTLVKGQTERAVGQLLYILGRVRDEQCRPLEGALAEIWQAAASGRYHHPDDESNRAPLDPNFQYWGRTLTDHEGRYRFKTIVPAPYPAGLFWTRPAHIHFKVHRHGYADLTTQMYFAGDPYLEKDRIFRAIPSAERPRVTVELEKPGPGFEPESRVCRFDLTLRRGAAG